MILFNLRTFVADNSIVHVAEQTIDKLAIGCQLRNRLHTLQKRRGVPNHRQHEWPSKSLFWLTWKNQSSALLTLCDGNSPLTGRFPSQTASNPESVSVSWRYYISFRIVTTHELLASIWTPSFHNFTMSKIKRLISHDNELLYLSVHFIDQPYVSTLFKPIYIREKFVHM